MIIIIKIFSLKGIIMFQLLGLYYQISFDLYNQSKLLILIYSNHLVQLFIFLDILTLLYIFYFQITIIYHLLILLFIVINFVSNAFLYLRQYYLLYTIYLYPFIDFF